MEKREADTTHTNGCITSSWININCIVCIQGRYSLMRCVQSPVRWTKIEIEIELRA
jgi:hypothetical protein